MPKLFKKIFKNVGSFESIDGIIGFCTSGIGDGGVFGSNVFVLFDVFVDAFDDGATPDV